MTEFSAPLCAPAGAPARRPLRGCFSTGPTAKPPTWSLDRLAPRFHAGRSHRSPLNKSHLKSVIERSKRLLSMPDDWLCALVPASDTGAVELALWNFLSEDRGVDALAFDAFSAGWAADIKGPLALKNARIFNADYGKIPNLQDLDFDRDVVLTWNGTTAGTCLPDGDFIPKDRTGLVICDATSAAFAVDLPFDRLDVVTWSWQKSLGGEAGHGMIALSPAAQERLESQPPPRGLPKIFSLTKSGKINRGLFAGATINTPSMLAVADHLLGLDWAEDMGGLSALKAKVLDNYSVVSSYIEASNRWEFLASDPTIRSRTALCLICTEPRFLAMDKGAQQRVLKGLEQRLADLDVAYDIGSYRDAPPGLRLWAGPTVESEDLTALMPWIDWAFEQEMAHA